MEKPALFILLSIAILIALQLDRVKCHNAQAEEGNILGKLSDSVNFDNVFSWVFGEEDVQHEVEEHFGYLRGGKEKLSDLAASIGIEPHFLNFKAHDYDNNDKIDGLELFTVISNEKNPNTAVMDRTQHQELCTKIIDRLLQDEDLNNDGYLDYNEYSRARNRLVRESVGVAH